MTLDLGTVRLDLEPGRPLIMGIVNLNPDSVATRSHLTTLEAQLEFALKLHADGARIIDIGAESGRTDQPRTGVEREIEQLVPLVEQLSGHGVIVSVDTWKPEVAEAVTSAGAHIINDVSGLADPALADIAARSGAGLVLMHTRVAPGVEHFPPYADVVDDVITFLRRQMTRARSRGVKDEQLILDPGPDFAKTPTETVAVLRQLPELVSLGRPVLLAVSRKYFIGAITGREPEDRLAGTLAAVDFGVGAGAGIVRVHDVREVREFLELRRLLDSREEVRLQPDFDDERLKWLPVDGTSE